MMSDKSPNGANNRDRLNTMGESLILTRQKLIYNCHHLLVDADDYDDDGDERLSLCSHG